LSTCASTLDSRGGLPPAGLHATAIGAELPGRALRHAREIVYDMRRLGMAVPPVYARMTEEFQTLVRSGAYTDWVASSQVAARWHVTRTTETCDQGNWAWPWSRSGDRPARPWDLNGSPGSGTRAEFADDWDGDGHVEVRDEQPCTRQDGA
jgi:hypothetical protein